MRMLTEAPLICQKVPAWLLGKVKRLKQPERDNLVNGLPDHFIGLAMQIIDPGDGGTWVESQVVDVLTESSDKVKRILEAKANGKENKKERRATDPV